MKAEVLLTILKSHGPVAVIAIFLVVFVANVVIRGQEEIRREHAMLARIMFAQCMNLATSEMQRDRCVSAMADAHPTRR